MKEPWILPRDGGLIPSSMTSRDGAVNNLRFVYASIAQLVEYDTCNIGVVGSSPTRGSLKEVAPQRTVDNLCLYCYHRNVLIRKSFIGFIMQKLIIEKNQVL